MITKKIQSALLIGVMLIAATSCVNASATSAKDKEKNTPISKTIAIGDFNEIEVATGIKVVYSQAPNPGTAKIETTSALEDRLVVKTVGKSLKVYFQNNRGTNLRTNGETVVTVSSPYLNEIEASSSGSVIVNGELKTDGKISVESSSSGSVNLGTVICKTLDLESSSSGSIDVKSLRGNLDAEASSSGSISLDAVNGSRLEAEASSSGDVNIQSAICTSIEVEAGSAGSVNVKGIKCDSLEAEASSAGKVVVEGECRFFDKDENSAGKVRHSKLEVRR